MIKINTLSGILLIFLVVVLVIAAFWYSNTNGEQAQKNDIKEKINSLYNEDVIIEEVEYIDNGLKEAGDEWMVEYKVQSTNTCVKYRSWLSPKDTSLVNTEEIDECN